VTASTISIPLSVLSLTNGIYSSSSTFSVSNAALSSSLSLSNTFSFASGSTFAMNGGSVSQINMYSCTFVSSALSFSNLAVTNYYWIGVSGTASFSSSSIAFNTVTLGSTLQLGQSTVTMVSSTISVVNVNSSAQTTMQGLSFSGTGNSITMDRVTFTAG